MDLRQVLYLSTEARRMGDGDLHALRSEALTNNARHGVTGLLLHVDRLFLQVIEGPSASIDQLYANVRNDRRNKDIVEILDRSVESRAFPAWTMGFHAPGGTAANGQSGFLNLRNREAFDAIERNDESLFSMMQGLYAANAGRGF